MKDIDSVNHVGLVVRDLDSASARYEQLGFVLTPLSVHAGSARPGGPVVPLGSGNRCAVFRDNYLEVLARVGETATTEANRVDRWLERHEGAHIICFGCGDAEVVDRRLTGAGFTTSGVVALQREVDTPDGPATARFDRVLLPQEATPEGLIQAAHHRTPQHIHQPRYIEHPNRVVALSEVILAVDDPEAFEARYAGLLGRPARRDGVRRSFELPLVSTLTVVAADDAGELLGAGALPASPCIAGVAMASTDLGAVRDRLDGHERIDGRLVVPGDAACGMAIAFEQVS